MIVSIDNEPYHLDAAKIAHTIKDKYVASGGGHAITLLNGKKLDIGKKSVFRLAIKSMLVPVALPILQALADKYNYVLASHVKHEDLIDYIIINTLDLIAANEAGVHIYVSTQISDIGCKSFISFSTTKREQINTEGEKTTKQDTVIDEDTGRGNDLLCRKDGNG